MSARLKSIITISIFVVSFFALFANAHGYIDTPAKSAILIEFSTGTVIYEKDADTPYPPASITKIMTELLALEALDKGLAQLDDQVYVSERAWRTEGSRMFLEVESRVPYKDIITGISVVSANDGCVAVAEHIYGSVERFVQVMNKRAAEIGLTGSHFKNPHGLPEEGHYMTARDIALLARTLIQKYPQILEVTSMRGFTHNNIYQPNLNPLLGNFPGADGLKTGWTTEAGYCLVSTAMQNGMRLIGVVLNTKDEAERFAASKELLAYGFQNYELHTPVNSGDIVADIDVAKGIELTVSLKAKDTLTILVPSERKSDIRLVPVLYKDSLKAPVQSGIPAGKLEVRLDDEVLATTEIATADSVKKAGFFKLLLRFIMSIFK